VDESATNIYSDAFVAPGRHELVSAPVVINKPGVRGVAVIRLLVTDDSGYDRLVADVDGPWRGVVFVLEQASRCAEFLRGRPGWSGHSEMAMVLRDLNVLPSKKLPNGLGLRLVNRDSSEGSDATFLKSVAAVAVASDPSVTDSADQVASFLRGLPSSARVLAAFDQDGVARATSACHVFGEYTQIFFVNTEPSWRRQGIGRAMTLEALRTAASLGARRAILHATDDGLPVYKSLGFEDVGMLTRFAFESEA